MQIRKFDGWGETAHSSYLLLPPPGFHMMANKRFSEARKEREIARSLRISAQFRRIESVGFGMQTEQNGTGRSEMEPGSKN